MIRKLLREKRLFCDGGMGSVLQSLGLKGGEAPEIWNITNPQKITEVHKAYLDAGADIITANTFGINMEKYENFSELLKAGIDCAKAAAKGKSGKFVALDIGPTGRMLEPLGDLEFEKAVEIFAENIKAGVKYGADLVLIETMNDSLETKAAIVAAKENCNLPIFVTNVYDENGNLMTGADALAMVSMLEGLRVDAIGINCSLGPDKMLPVVRKLCEYSSLPVIVNPNAGLPSISGGKTVYSYDSERFSDLMVKIADCGAAVLGGCCGTTPEHIEKTVKKCKNLPYNPPKNKGITVVSSYTHGVIIGEKPILIGERINPTGKPKFKEALRQGNIDYIVNEGIRQSGAGVQILDVNVGLPEIDEEQIMLSAVKSLQAVCDTPLQIDTPDSRVMEKAMRIYNGKPLINSVNGNIEVMEKIFPLVSKYGGVVVALTLDESGIPQTAQGRVKIAEKIINEAQKYGISKKDIIVDPLTLTISSNTESAKITLDAVKILSEMGINTVLGVSNISFGMPNRELINETFFANALYSGLSCAIMNPFSKGMMNAYYSYNALSSNDKGFADYFSYTQGIEKEIYINNTECDLKTAVFKGLKNEAVAKAKEMLQSISPLDIINEHIIPALDMIGIDYENKKAFLPQLLMSADAGVEAISVVKEKMNLSESKEGKPVIIATVKGDIHDIGKNIVKIMLESYGFRVYDLGKDVSPQKVLEKAKEYGCSFIGLSALMTTTVPAMEETVKLLKANIPDCRIMVGGAVLTRSYAELIGADFYAKDAMAAVRCAEEFYK